MNAAIEEFNALAAAWCARAWLVFWQSTALLAAVALIALFWRGGSPAARCWLWRLLAIKLLVMPLWVVSVPWLATSLAFGSAGAIVEAARGHSSHAELQGDYPLAQNVSGGGSSPRLTASSWAVLIWLAPAVLCLVRIGQQWRRLGRLLRHAVAPNDPSMTSVSDKLCRAMQLRAVAVMESAAATAPFVCGVFRPILVVPEGLSSQLRAGELRAVLAHELAHVRRGDLVWCWLGELARIVYWFHPLVHWVVRQEVLERELACDRLAMRTADRRPGEYAQTLVRVAGYALSRRIRAVEARPRLSLDRFWRCRLGRLTALDRAEPRVSRPVRVAVTAAAVALLAIPTLRPVLQAANTVSLPSGTDRIVAQGVLLLPALSAAEATIVTALAGPVPVDIAAQPLRSALSVLADAADINIVIDRRALEEVHLDPEFTVSFAGDQSPLATVLDRILVSLGLTYTVENDVLLVTTITAAQLRPAVRVYPVADLAAEPAELERLRTVITTTVVPMTWSECGGPGAAVAFDYARALIVCNDQRVHRKVDQLLLALRESRFGKEHVR